MDMDALQSAQRQWETIKKSGNPYPMGDLIAQWRHGEIEKLLAAQYSHAKKMVIVEPMKCETNANLIICKK